MDENGEKIRLRSGEYKSRKIAAVDWNEQDKAEQWRAAWAETANRYLELAGEAYAGLERHLQNLMGKQNKLAHELSPIRKKLEVVAERISRYETYKERTKPHTTSISKEYNAQRPWKRKAFEDNNRLIINNYETSKSYIESILNSNKKIPIAAWQREYSELSAELRKLTGEYQSLKDEVSTVNKIRVNVYDILRKERQREQPRRSRDVER